MVPSHTGRSDPQITRHLSKEDWSLESIVEAAEAFRSLRGHRGWELLVALLEAEAATVDRGMQRGVLDSRAEYAFAHGRKGGLEAAPQFVEALIEKADARLAEQRERHEGAAEPVPAGV